METAKQLRAVPHDTVNRERLPDRCTEVVGTAEEIREFAACKFEELARMLRSGQLDGASCEWRRDSARLVHVAITAPDESGNATVELITTAIEQVDQPVQPMLRTVE